MLRTIVAATALALAACSGGGTVAELTPPPEPPAETPVEPLVAGPGLTIGDSPAYAASPADMRLTALADAANRLRAFTSNIVRENVGAAGHPDARVTITDQAAVASVGSDGNYGMRLTVVDGRAEPAARHEIHFPASSLSNGAFIVDYEGYGYWLWAYSDTPFDGSNYSSGEGYVGFLGLTGGPHGDRMIIVYGVETPANRPAGRDSLLFRRRLCRDVR